MSKEKWTPVEFRGGAEGVLDANKFRAKCQRPKFVADCLARYQQWRCGKGEYAFNEDPSKNAPRPFCGKALSIIEEEAIGMLLKYHSLMLEKKRESK